MFVVVCVDGICVSSAKESFHDHGHTCPANPAARFAKGYLLQNQCYESDVLFELRIFFAFTIRFFF